MRGPSTLDYLLGLAFLLAILAPCAVVSHVLVSRTLGHLRGVVRGVALFTTFTAATWVVHVGPAVAGALSRWTAAGCAIALLAGTLAVRPRSGGEPPAAALEAPAPAWPSRLPAALGVGAAIVGGVAFLLAYSPLPVISSDAAGNHVPQIVRWIQTGSVWQLTGHSAHLGHATYPQSGNAALLVAVLPWRSSFLAGYVPAFFVAATAVGVYALAREIGAPPTSSALAGAAVAALPAVTVTSLQYAGVDAPMLAWFSAGALFLVRSARTGDRAELLLAGSALGLAFGTKWYAVLYVPVLVAVWLIARRRAHAGLVLTEAAVLTAAIASFGAIWLLRNWVLTGNPLHPVRVAPLGLTIFDAPPDLIRERFGFTVSDYLLDGRVWRDFLLPAYAGNFGLLGPVLLVAGAGAAVVAGVRRCRDSGAVRAVVAASLAVGLLYAAVIPDTAYGPRGVPFLAYANTRYLVPALLGGAVLAAWLAGRAGRARPAVEAVMLVAVLDALRRSYESLSLAALVAGAAVVLALVVTAAVVRDRPHRRGVVAGAAALALAVSGWLVWRADAWTSLGDQNPAIAAMQQRAPGERRVAIAGIWEGVVSPVLPAYGRYLDNRVDYLGRFERGTLRPVDEREEFVRRLRTGRYDLLLAGTGSPARPAGDQPEVAWAQEAGYRVVARTRAFVLLVA